MSHLEKQHPNIQNFPEVTRTEAIKVSHSDHFFLMFIQNQFRVLWPKYSNSQILFGQTRINFHRLHVGTVWQICVFCSLDVSSLENGRLKQKHVPGPKHFSTLFTGSCKLKHMPVIFLLFHVIFTTLLSNSQFFSNCSLILEGSPRFIFLVTLYFSRNVLCMKVGVGHCRQLLIHRILKLL